MRRLARLYAWLTATGIVVALLAGLWLRHPRAQHPDYTDFPLDPIRLEDDGHKTRMRHHSDSVPPGYFDGVSPFDRPHLPDDFRRRSK
jgi:hypothetical protein